MRVARSIHFPIFHHGKQKIDSQNTQGAPFFNHEPSLEALNDRSPEFDQRCSLNFRGAWVFLACTACIPMRYIALLPRHGPFSIHFHPKCGGALLQGNTRDHGASSLNLINHYNKWCCAKICFAMHGLWQKEISRRCLGWLMRLKFWNIICKVWCIMSLGIFFDFFGFPIACRNL